MDGEKIFNLSLSGSIHCLPVGIVEEMEVALKGMPGDEKEIGKVVRSFFEKPQVQIANAKPEDFLQAILGAVKKAESPN
jgi:hypothetical protein